VGNSVKGNRGARGVGRLTGGGFFESCCTALNVFIRRGSGWGSEIKRCFWGVEMNPPVRPDDRYDGDDGDPSENLGGKFREIPDDQKELFYELNTSEMQVLRLKASVELFFSDIRSALAEPEGNPKLKVLGTEAATLGIYLQDGKDEEDLTERSELVWSVFNEFLASDPEVAERGLSAINYFAFSIIQKLATSLVKIKCNEGLERVRMDAGMEVGKFLTEVNNRGLGLDYLKVNVNKTLEQRELESASIRRDLESSGKEIVKSLLKKYQQYGTNFEDLLDGALAEFRLNKKYVPPFIILSDEGVNSLRALCFQECGSSYEIDLNKSLQDRINQIEDALRSVGAIQEGGLLFY
jgi:hypothetical protein